MERGTWLAMAVTFALVLALWGSFALVDAGSRETVTISPEVYSMRETTSNTMALTVSPGYAWIPERVWVHLSGAGTGNLTITRDYAGTAWDQKLATWDTSSGTDYVWPEYQSTPPSLQCRPYNPMQTWGSGDALKVDWTNGTGRTYGVEVTWRKESP